jgi:hypothetical protein
LTGILARLAELNRRRSWLERAEQPSGQLNRRRLHLEGANDRAAAAPTRRPLTG